MPPARGLSRLGLAHPAELLLDAPGDGGEKVAGLQFGQGLGLGVGERLGPLQHGPAEGLGQLVVFGFGPADLVDRLGEQLHHMEPVDGDGGVVEVFADGGEEGGRHVADHFGDTAWLAAMLDQEGVELGERVLALPGVTNSTGLSLRRRGR